MIKRLPIAFVVVLLLPRAAVAQVASAFEVSAGYSWMNDTTDAETLPAGWEAGAAAALSGWLSVAGEVGAQYRTVPLFTGELKLRTYSALFGLRASARIGPFIEFGQVLGGVSHATGTAFGSTDTVTHVAWQPGAGLDLPAGRHLRLRAEIDERLVSNVRELRLAGAIVISSGR